MTKCIGARTSPWTPHGTIFFAGFRLRLRLFCIIRLGVAMVSWVFRIDGIKHACSDMDLVDWSDLADLVDLTDLVDLVDLVNLADLGGGCVKRAYTDVAVGK